MVEILRKRHKVANSMLAFWFIGFLLLTSCSLEPKNEENHKIIDETFVALNDDGFVLEGESFFPIMINYVADFRFVEDSFVLGVHKHYEKQDVYEYFSLDSIVLQRQESLTLIKDMGFNTIRLCLDRIWGQPDSSGYPTGGPLLMLNDDKEIIFSAIEDFLTEANERDLKVMMLIPSPVQNKYLSKFTIALLHRFSENNVIFSYDFNNEPLYDRAHSAMSKKEIHQVVTEWKEWMTQYAPKQLLTIGYSEPIEVFAWDPSILPVDFLSFHTYNPLRVPNEIYWYANYSGKPWMIGETALRVDNEEIPYEWQADYMQAAFDYTVACGGIGFGWWGYQEVPKISLSEESTGLMTSSGTIYTSDSILPLTGTLKPAVKIVKELNPDSVTMSCKRQPNYFNMLGYTNYVIKGKLVDEDEQPIEGGVIRGWNQYHIIGQNTYTDEKGNFTLYSNDVIHHMKISAPGKELLEINEIQKYEAVNSNSPEEVTLPDRELEYQQIDYRNYIAFNDSTRQPIFFGYKKGIFDKAYYSKDLGTLELKSWD